MTRLSNTERALQNVSLLKRSGRFLNRSMRPYCDVLESRVLLSLAGADTPADAALTDPTLAPSDLPLPTAEIFTMAAANDVVAAAVAGASFDAVTGILTVDGTAGADVLTFTSLTADGVGLTDGLTSDSFFGVTRVDVNLNGGGDTIILNQAGGVLFAPIDGFRIDGGAGTDALVLEGGSLAFEGELSRDVLTGIGTITYGNGVEFLDIQFQNVEPVIDTTTALSFTVTGRNIGENYLVSPGSSPTTGLVTIDGGNSYEFANKSVLVLDGAGGIDAFRYANPGVPDGLSRVEITGTGTGNSFLLEGSAGQDTFEYLPVSGSQAIVSRNGLDFQVSSTAGVGIRGQGGNDRVIVQTEAGEEKISFTPAVAGDSGTLNTVTTAGNVTLVTLAVDTLGAGGRFTILSGNEGVREDQLTILGDVTSETFNVTAAGTVGSSVRVGFDGNGIAGVTINSVGGEDLLNISGAHPFSSVTFNAADGPDRIVFNGTGDPLFAAFGTTNGAGTLRQAGRGLVVYTDVSLIDINAAGAETKITPATPTDLLVYAQNTPVAGTTQIFTPGKSPILQVTNGTVNIPTTANPVTFSGTTGADIVTVNFNQIVINGVAFAYSPTTTLLTINLLDGNDQITLNGVVVDVLIDGGLGDDVVTLVNLSGKVTVNGAAGNDTLNALNAGAAVTLNGGAGNDAFFGGAGADQIDGGNGFDTIDGGAGNDLLSGGEDNDTVIWKPGDGSDTVDGGNGLDTLDFRGGVGVNDDISLSVANNRLILSRQPANVILSVGTVEEVNLTTFSGRDQVTVNNPLINAGVGIVRAALGAGDNEKDVVRYRGTTADDSISASINSTANGVRVLGTLTEVLITESNGSGADADQLVIEGLAGNDILSVQGNLNALIGTQLDGQDGNDALTGDATINGGAGNDLITGGALANLLNGDAGNDTIIGNAGDDTIDGGLGNDSITGGAGNDNLVGGDGNDVLGGGVGDDVVLGQVGNDTITGDAGLDQLWGGAGADNLDGGADADTLIGGAGNDTLTGQDGNDMLFGEAGDDSLTGNFGDDSLFGGDGADWLHGGNGIPSVPPYLLSTPFDGNDVLSGGNGADRLDAGNGANYLDAGADGIREIGRAGRGPDTVYNHMHEDAFGTDGGGKRIIGRGGIADPVVPAETTSRVFISYGLFAVEPAAAPAAAIAPAAVAETLVTASQPVSASATSDVNAGGTSTEILTVADPSIVQPDATPAPAPAPAPEPVAVVPDAPAPAPTPASEAASEAPVVVTSTNKPTSSQPASVVSKVTNPKAAVAAKMVMARLTGFSSRRMGRVPVK